MYKVPALRVNLWVRFVGPPSVTPEALLICKLAMVLLMNKNSGMVCELDPCMMRVELALLASILLPKAVMLP